MLIGLFLFVQYGAEMMESSVKTISRPVMDRLPVNQLDEFACRQLDRVRSLPFEHIDRRCAEDITQLGNYGRRQSSPDIMRDRSRQREESPGRTERGWTSALRDHSTARGRTRESTADSYGDRDEEDVSMTRDDGK